MKHKKTILLTYLFSFGFLFSLNCVSASAQATVYECHTKNDYKWSMKENGVIHRTSRASRNHSILLFDDEAAILVYAFNNENADAIPTQMTIVQKQPSFKVLLAQSVRKLSGPDSPDFTIDVFRIFINSFIYYSTGDNAILTGTCHEGLDKEAQRILRYGKQRLKNEQSGNPFAKPPAVLGRLKAVERILE